MALSQAQAKQIVDSMQSAKLSDGTRAFNDEEIVDTLRLQGMKIEGDMPWEKPAAQQALEVLGPMAAAMAGGAALPAAAEALLPAAAKFIPRAILSGAGQGISTAAALKLEGKSTEEAVQGGLAAGTMGGLVEGGLNVGARLLSAGTSLPEGLIGRTLGKSTNQARKAIFGKPGEMAERTMGLGTLKRLEEASSVLSPGRLTKMEIIDAADSAGVKIPLSDVFKSIDVGVANAGKAVGRANSIAVARLTRLADELKAAFPNGTLTASQADAQLQAFQRDAAMSAARGNPFLASTYYDLKSTLRASFHGAVEKGMPGSGLAQATADAHRYLNAIETLEGFVKAKTPEDFVRGLFAESAQSERAALREFETQTGTNGRFEQAMLNLADKRSWTTAERGRAHGLYHFISKIAVTPLVKAATVSARPAGQLAAAAAAGSAGASPSVNEQPTSAADMLKRLTESFGAPPQMPSPSARPTAPVGNAFSRPAAPRNLLGGIISPSSSAAILPQGMSTASTGRQVARQDSKRKPKRVAYFTGG